MRTTIDIDNDLLKEVMEKSGAKSKKGAPFSFIVPDTDSKTTNYLPSLHWEGKIISHIQHI